MKHQKIEQFPVDSCIVQTFDSVFSIALFWRLSFWGVILLLLLHLLFVSAKLFYREPVFVCFTYVILRQCAWGVCANTKLLCNWYIVMLSENRVNTCITKFSFCVVKSLRFWGEGLAISFNILSFTMVCLLWCMLLSTKQSSPMKKHNIIQRTLSFLYLQTDSIHNSSVWSIEIFFFFFLHIILCS